MADEEKDTEVWIVSHYGPISSDSKLLYIASVKVMGGVAVGTGFTEEDSYKSLYKDLTGFFWPETNGNTIN